MIGTPFRYGTNPGTVRIGGLGTGYRGIVSLAADRLDLVRPFVESAGEGVGVFIARSSRQDGLVQLLRAPSLWVQEPVDSPVQYGDSESTDMDTPRPG